MLTILSEKGCHKIFAPPQYLENPEYYKTDWAHELCHALLAEKIDLIFGGSAVLGKLDPKERERRAKILFFNRLHEDLFVNDVRDELLGHQLTIEDVRSAHLSLEIIKFDQRNQEILSQTSAKLSRV